MGSEMCIRDRSKALNRAFKMNVEDEVYNHLIDELETMKKTEESE